MSEFDMKSNKHAEALEAMSDPLRGYDDLPQEAKVIIDRSVETVLTVLRMQGKTVTENDVRLYRDVCLRIFRQEIITSYVDFEEDV